MHLHYKTYDDAELVSLVSNYAQGRLKAQAQCLTGAQIAGLIIGLLLAFIIIIFIIRRRRKRY